MARKVEFRVVVTDVKATGPHDTPEEEAVNLRSIILDGLGYPDESAVKIEVEVLDAVDLDDG